MTSDERKGLNAILDMLLRGQIDDAIEKVQDLLMDDSVEEIIKAQKPATKEEIPDVAVVDGELRIDDRWEIDTDLLTTIYITAAKLAAMPAPIYFIKERVRQMLRLGMMHGEVRRRWR